MPFFVSFLVGNISWVICQSIFCLSVTVSRVSVCVVLIGEVSHFLHFIIFFKSALWKSRISKS